MRKNNLQFNKGYTLLFAVLVSALVLSIGISILNINKKEFLLASSARESMSAFYAADAGLECAVYWDNQPGFFDTIDHSSSPSAVFAAATYTCSEHSPKEHPGVSYYQRPSGSNVNTYTFDIQLDGSSCATVTVSKDPNNTTIVSRGYNIGWYTNIDNKEVCDQASPKRVERALEYHYGS